MGFQPRRSPISLNVFEPIDFAEKVLTIGGIPRADGTHVDRRLRYERVARGYEGALADPSGRIEVDFELLHTSSHCDRLHKAPRSVAGDLSCGTVAVEQCHGHRRTTVYAKDQAICTESRRTVA